MMRVAHSLGYESLFLAAYRESGLPRHDSWEGLQLERIGRPFPLLNGTRPLTYISGCLSYAMAALRRLQGFRPSVVHASDFECGAIGVAYKGITASHFIYNIHDNLAQRYIVPRPVSWLLNQFEGLIVAASDVTLVPEGFRRDALPKWCRRKVRIVRNSPEDPGFRPHHRQSSDPVRLFFGGWIDRGRGLQQLADLVQRNSNFSLVLAGEGSLDTIKWVKSLPKVSYLGFLSHARILEETAKCDMVVALYDPARPINIFAASNKIAESLAIGRPILVNSEARIASYLGARGCSVQAPYAEIADSGPQIQKIMSDPAAYSAACRAARQSYESDYSFDKIRRQIAESFPPTS